MPIRRSQKKRNAEPRQKQNHRRLVIDPMVNPGSSAHRHQARSKADPTRPHHRMVTLAQSSPGDRSARAPQSKTATVMLSQEADVAEPRPLEVGGHGHGCGHNLLGSAALLAATAVKDWLAAHKMPGRVRYYGCPAEEGGAAKTFMVRSGAFDDADIAITWHPSSFWEVVVTPSLANTRADFVFTGRAAHAAASPHLGRSALDAVELMNVGVNYMREHMPSDARVHYALLDSGGIAPNVVQAHARVRYSIRARDLPGMNELVERVG